MPIESEVNIPNANVVLTQDILVNILRRLSLRKILESGLIDKKFREASKSNLLWEEKFKCHFPDHYKNFAVKTDINWYVEFQKVYEHEYEGLPESTKKLLPIIKESNMESLAKAQVSFETLKNTQDRHGHSLLNWAQKIGDQEILVYLFDGNAYNKSKFFSKTLLYWAIALQQDYKKILYLISEGRWPESTEGFLEPQIKPELLNKRMVDDDYNTLLCMAAGAGHLPLVQYLLKQPGIDLNVRNEHGDTPVLAAAKGGHGKVITELEKAGAAICFANRGMFPIHCAASTGQLDAVQALIALKPELLNQKYTNDYTPLMLAVENSHLQTVCYLSQQKYIDLNVGIPDSLHHKDGRTVLHLVRPSKDCGKIVAMLLKAGADPTIADNDECLFPLHKAVKERNLDAVKAFIENKPELLNQIDVDGVTPLMRAVFRDNLPIVRYFLAQDAICLSTEDTTVLHDAIIWGRLSISKEIIKNKPELLNQTDKYGFTPLMWAVKGGDLPLVQFLLAQDNIDLCATATKGIYQGKIALQLAENPRIEKIVLLEHDAKHDLLANPELENILLEYYVKHDLPIDTELNDLQKAKVELFKYIKRREQGPEYKTSFTFFCIPFNFGFSREQKVIAAKALRLVILGEEDGTHLKRYQKELNNGELKGIYHRYLLAKNNECHNDGDPKFQSTVKL